MKKFFAAVIILVLFAMGWYTVAYFVRPVKMIELSEYTYEAMVSCDNAFIVRDETVYYATTAGILYNNTDDGERVSKNDIISSVFNTGIDSAYIKKLRAIDGSINRLEDRISAGSYNMDEYTAESDIYSGLNSVVSLAEKNSVSDVRDLKEEINSYRSGEIVSPEKRLDELLIERENIENILANQRSDILSASSGIFSSYVDGLEAVLIPDRTQEYSVQYIRSLVPGILSRREGDTVVTGDPICKIMNNHVWYVLGISDETNKELCAEGKSVYVRFPGITSIEVKGSVTYTSEPDDNGEYIFLIKIPSYLETAFSYRQARVELIFEKYEGYKIPLDAIHTKKGLNEYYVNAMKGSEQHECDCDILFTDNENEYAIIQSTETAKNRLSSMERLVVGER